ncbi:hypothetical protein [Olleya aquimaris]|nr:hypothetical protein [Olleya aquimaris]
MKAIINYLKKSNRFTNEHEFANREVFRCSNTKDGLWKGVTRYAH